MCACTCQLFPWTWPGPLCPWYRAYWVNCHFGIFDQICISADCYASEAPSYERLNNAASKNRSWLCLATPLERRLPCPTSRQRRFSNAWSESERNSLNCVEQLQAVAAWVEKLARDVPQSRTYAQVPSEPPKNDILKHFLCSSQHTNKDRMVFISSIPHASPWHT